VTSFAARARRPWRFVPLLLVLILTVSGSGLTSMQAQKAQAQPASRTFPETGKTVSGDFLTYWDTHGGLLQYGYPISDPMLERSDTDGKTYSVQYFERALFELHPELAAPDDVLLALLGTFQYKQKYPDGAPGQKANTQAGAQRFVQTGYTVGGNFLNYWIGHGGLAQQGYPISDEFTEVSGFDGKPYTVQYFQRAEFELHPENQAPYNVLLSQLGTLRYSAKYAAPTPTSSPTPTGSISPVALAYLNEALDAMQTYSLASADADWTVIRSHTLAFAQALNPRTTADTYPAIQYALYLLGDRHSSFATPEQVKQETASGQQQAQIGISVSYEARTVTAVMTDSLAEQAGIKVGDVVYAINGTPAEGMDISTFFAQLYGGSKVELALKRQDTGKNHSIQDVQATVSHGYVDPSDVPHGRRLAGGVGYIAVPGVYVIVSGALGSSPLVNDYANIEQQIIREIDEGQRPTCGWVVDLQLNKGGIVGPMMGGVGPVLGEGKAWAAVLPNGDLETWYYRNGAVVYEDAQGEHLLMQVDHPYQLKNQIPPVAVLTGASTGSAGEATAISFRGRPGARSFGTPTAGVPNGPIGITLSDGALLGVAYAREADRTGHIYRYNENLQPDEVVFTEPGNKLTGTDADPVVQAGLKWLQGQPQCAK
jgi:carboxyl-terminal processing protease